MNYFFKFLKWLAISLVSLVLVLLIAMYAFGVDYILKGVYVIYTQGHQTAYLDDYRYFDNHKIEAGTPQPWAKSTAYNSVPLTDSLKSIHERWGSVAYVIIHQDSVWFEEYYGGYSDSSKSNSFSMAKSITAAILGKALEEGKVSSLQQKVKDFVPELAGPFAEALTMENLVSMSSGITWDESYYNPFSITTRLYFDKDIQGAIPALPVDKQPGLKFIYQSGDTQMLGIALQRATKSTLSELMSTYFWKPMGAEHSAIWQVDSEKYGIEKAYCCIASNAKDFARFGKLYLNHGRWNGQQLLDSAYVAQSIQPRYPDSPQYGYGWWMGQYKDKPYFYMDGHLGQYVIVVPQDELIIVRLGHGIDKIGRNNPQSSFYNFIDQAYQMLGSRIQ
ncbi:serine hydrolase domain-containing protein [Sphingobacterium hotanense]|uniref:serine hydrolase domain-containing protein n=1 Tax=Sphingobacterium hotanense TaxID=649196 RepID=UPI0021A92217|nr:serine hydrolase [Sphingobacterium hotanense]MCT1525411.1 beta-lactamase family protein [Sphingobacterium hotanense]